MTAFVCADVRELAPELAVNIVGGPDRAEALQHLSECGPCRALVSELSEAADALTLLAPEVEPPPGFERRVLAAVSAGGRRSRRRTVVLAAAVAAAACIVSIVGVRLVEGNDQRPVVAPAASNAVGIVPMTNDSGTEVGKLHVSNGHPAVVVVSVNYGIGHGNYAVQLRSPQRPVEQLGAIDVEQGHGSWGGTTKLPPDGTIAVVGPDGKDWCAATIPHVS